MMGYDVSGENYKVCPQLLVEPWQIEIIMAHRHYKNGLFSEPGGIGNQPPKYLEAMQIVDSEIALIENEKIDGNR